ncbi:oxidoreductase, short chain dehydrogenase/reductase family protein [Necator americanus]|uniref:Oxidoreductase, short chain dehydrogenase/reductase family protein n=1 Tax=Necator americanus TaxID=51031 RepID=W2SXG9_NECAM|nr:oxidoreductase, short chain dehydrogenase/reductase family protein [Necator americanus]ETN73571.1 oxidoreductase, short chain dehydrogenase/reductase family protein [Necator americanus]
MEVTTFFLGICIAYALFLLIRWFFERYEIEDLKNKAVFITGCDSGFGKALAIRCAERGMPVLAGCLLEKSISEYKELSKSYRTPIDAFLLDVTSDKSVIDAKKYVENRTQKYGGLHGVVNNAGILGHTFFDDFLTLEDYKKVAEVNTWGVIRVTQAMKSLVKKTRGRIVTVTSACSRVGVMSIGPYTTSKFAISGYCDVIRNELRMFGVSLHILEPGFFNTYLTSTENVEKQLNSLYAKCSEEAKNEYGKEFFIKMRTKTAWVLSLIGSNNIDYVTDAYFHALTAVYPRTRYQVGWDSILM